MLFIAVEFYFDRKRFPNASGPDRDTVWQLLQSRFGEAASPKKGAVHEILRKIRAGAYGIQYTVEDSRVVKLAEDSVVTTARAAATALIVFELHELHREAPRHSEVVSVAGELGISDGEALLQRLLDTGYMEPAGDGDLEAGRVGPSNRAIFERSYLVLVAESGGYTSALKKLLSRRVKA